MKKSFLWVACCALLITSCQKRQFTIEGTVTEAADSMLYLEHMSLNGPVPVDSVRLGGDGSFRFRGDAPEAPEFYRLRIAGQMINVSVDSVEQIAIKASYPYMSTGYEVTGSENCEKIKELSLLQLGLQARVNMIASSPLLGVEASRDSIETVINEYKESIKRNYIFREPMKAYSYFALFQTIQFGDMNALIFNPRSNQDDVKVFAAVATSWDTYYPNSERCANLHNIAIEGLKNIRILKARQEQAIDNSQVVYTDIIDIPLRDNKGVMRHLTDLKGKVVLLDFHVFAARESTERIMRLREIYNQYHAQGLEI